MPRSRRMRAADAVSRPARPAPRIWWLAGVLALASVVRLVYFVQLSATPFADHLFLDSQLYEAWAARIAGGDLEGGRGPFFTEPGYAYLLALVKVAGGGTTAVRLLQALAGIAIVALTAMLAQRLAGSAGRRAGLVAGSIAALYVPLIYFEGLVLKTTLEVLLCLALLHGLLLVAARPEPRRAIALGLAAGAAILIRGTVLALVLLGAVWLALVLRRRAAPRFWVASALLLAGPAFALAGTAVRSRLLSGEWTPLTWNSGINFYIGNCRRCTGGDPGYPFGRGLPQYEEEDSRVEAERRAGRPLSATASSSFWWREAWREILEAPERWARLLGVKTLLFWNHYEVSDNLSIYFVREWVPLLRWPLPGFWLAAPLGLAGLLWALREREAGGLLAAGFVLSQMALVVLFHVGERYRLCVVPVLLALGAGAVCRALAGGERAQRAALAAAAALGIALVALPNPVHPQGQNLANHYDMLGAAAMSDGSAQQAVEALRRAVAFDPSSADHHYNLGVALGSLGTDDAGAETELREALRLRPELGEAHFELGRLLDRGGRAAEAAAAFERAAGLGHRPAESLISAGAMWGRAKQYDRALADVNAGLGHNPEDAHGWEVLGGIRYQQGDRAGALAAWERSLRLSPDNPRLRQFVERTRAGTDGAPVP